MEIVDFTSETVVDAMTNAEAKFDYVHESLRCLQNHSCQLATLAEILEGIFQLIKANGKLILFQLIFVFIICDLICMSLLPQRASLKRASKAADPNFVLWVEIKIFYLAHCMTVPVNFDCDAVRSGIRQIGNVIIFHRGSAFSNIRRWFRHYMWCFGHYTLWFELIIRGAFAVIPGTFTINIRGAFTILIYAVVSQLYAVVQALYAVLLTLYAMLSFNIISIFFPCI